ncbi:MAG: fused MFS/spermidine synthase [Flavobacteriales bacterium]|nr:fused MFS/spermidine synthase [Flavobacteriales bacterium]
MKKNTLYYLLLLSFIEGATVMGTELMGAKMLAPFFGSSLYVWSSVMAITLGGLACGYFFGGILSSRKNNKLTLYRVLLIAALFTVLMPYTSKVALALFGLRSLLPAVISSSLLILFPPVFLMGAVSPLIIGIISKLGKDSGKVAGTVYAISTAGGILATFLFGFYIIPTFGLTIPAIVSGLILGVFPLISILKKKDTSGAIIYVVIVFLSVIKVYSQKNSFDNEYQKIIYEQEGLLGQIKVVDYDNSYYYQDSSLVGTNSRWLYVNRISQTKDNPFAREKKDEERYFTYIYCFTKVLNNLPEGKRNVLLLGLGGGSIVKHLTENGFNVEVCELDTRIEYVARKYFNLPKNIKVTIDDARHYIKTTDKKYDAIIFDTFKGEETPNHIITKESLVEVKNLLNPNGLLLINSFNFIEGEKGLGLRSIYKTLTNSGFKTQVWPTDTIINDRNLLFISSFTDYPIFPEYLDLKKIDFSDAQILTDSKPSFEILNGKAALEWRRWAIRNGL